MKMRKLKALAYLFAGMAAVGAAAMGSEQKHPIPFASVQIQEMRFRSFEDDAGGFYLVWIDGQTDKVFTLRAQHLDANGLPLWAAPGQTVSSGLSSFEDWSGLADGQGGVTLFWDEPDGVHAQRFRPD